MQISVIMTVKNGEKFLGKSLDCILQQSFKPKDIVVVDDGSSDNTWPLLDQYAKKFGCIKALKTSGIGRAQALNLAWKNTEGDWIANIDVDDWWHQDKLSAQVKCAETYPECSFIITDTIVTHDDNFDISKISENDIVDFYSILTKKNLYSNNPINHSSVLLRKELLQSVSGYNEKLRRQIDYDLWVRILALGHLIYKVNKKLSIKYVHDNQSFEANNRLAYLRHALKMNYVGLVRLKAPFWHYCRPIASFIFGLLPRFFRSILKKSLLNKT